ncbi:hypothetical protein HK100_006997 [Physocladia obscura]|uniref:Zn(2)-C6 fungal-type domain-containing protein n=1 Tax=Physocladia obscura TaxID=109957 RepID=A0AAD5SQU1_9FUNG|nr:hypothetical protein HK100_006997 [Physocladia obscura]
MWIVINILELEKAVSAFDVAVNKETSYAFLTVTMNTAVTTATTSLHPFPNQCTTTNKRLKSCEGCRLSNRKCDRKTPCKRCSHLNLPCIYSNNSTRNKKYKDLKRTLKDGTAATSASASAATSPELIEAAAAEEIEFEFASVAELVFANGCAVAVPSPATFLKTVENANDKSTTNNNLPANIWPNLSSPVMIAAHAASISDLQRAENGMYLDGDSLDSGEIAAQIEDFLGRDSNTGNNETAQAPVNSSAVADIDFSDFLMNIFANSPNQHQPLVAAAAVTPTFNNLGTVPIDNELDPFQYFNSLPAGLDTLTIPHGSTAHNIPIISNDSVGSNIAFTLPTQFHFPLSSDSNRGQELNFSQQQQHSNSSSSSSSSSPYSSKSYSSSPLRFPNRESPAFPMLEIADDNDVFSLF